MSKISMLGTIKCQEGQEDAMEAVLASMVDAAREEPGTEVYSYHRGEDGTFWFFALMASHAAMESHGQSDAMKAAMAAFMPLADGRPEMHVAKPVAAIGLDI